MPKRKDIESILIIGAGPIVIGQACEFDYSGTQACKALKEDGYRIVLVNSNPATIMTDPNLADSTYIEPITPAMVEKIIRKERPDAILPTIGGQTALNTAMALYEAGILDRFGVELIGASPDSIAMAEDRKLFKEAMNSIGLATPKAVVANSANDIEKALEYIGLPSIIRPSYTLGGTGGGIAYNKDEFTSIVLGGLEASPVSEVLVEQSVLGWKEYEMEVVRDQADNCIIVCSIENIDPMGIHTGDSITVAPALTLTDKEYQLLRNASIACLRKIGVDTGGSNVQFAVNPENGDLVIIEMNPRVSRSSALASKATGFPIAKVASRLAVGYTLDELKNDITGGAIPASFEPTIDYVVTKIPRFNFEKFPSASPLLTTSMKSVGEAMAIGRNFQESLQKALRSMETGLTGLNEVEITDMGDEVASIRAALSIPVPDRILRIAQAFRSGTTIEEVFQSTSYDPWFLEQIADLVSVEESIKENGMPSDPLDFRIIKSKGFSDSRLAELTGVSEEVILSNRQQLGVHPVYKRIDTCAAEFESVTPYMYSTFGGSTNQPECEAKPTVREKIIVLGGGPNRIGQGIEFDYCCVHAVLALRQIGYETIMVNCNPETVSTDYDTSDRLYFEPLTAEDVMEVVRIELGAGSLKGVIVQLGGQTPLKLAQPLEGLGVPILGTSPDAIDLAEDRERFQAFLRQLKLKQPPNGIATSYFEAQAITLNLGYPVVVRPSYVLGGRGMEIVHNDAQLEHYMREAVKISKSSPILIDAYLRDAIEIDVDALSDGTSVMICGVMEHIEEAGIHSGDSACSLPPYSLPTHVIDEIRRQTVALATELKVVGLMNVQFAIRDKEIFVLEVNPRASRTIPFVAKTIGQPIAMIAARVMAGEKLTDLNCNFGEIEHVAVKEAVFPFERFSGVDVLLGPEMKSTGEVMGLDDTFAGAFAKAQLAAGISLPEKGNVFISVKDRDKPQTIQLAKDLNELGFNIIATRGTAGQLELEKVPVEVVNKVLEGRPHIVDAITDKNIHLIFNTTEGEQAITDSFTLRRAALLNHVPYYTTIAGARAAVQAINNIKHGRLEVAALQSYF